MFTNNFILLQKAAFMCANTTLKRISGSDLAISYDGNYTYRYAGLGRWLNIGRCQSIVNNATVYNGFTNDLGLGGVWFGTDPTPATKDDYTLGSVITSGLSVTSPTAVTQKDEGGGKYTFLSDFIVRNDTEADISIYEIGLFTAPGSGNNGYNVLMEHTVLPEPITIPAGESRLVTYKLTFNQTLSVD